ncbi:hypothetical protein NQ317_009402 [Molorchus minor]|uniref:Peroxisome assembly protein 12 n=1 Tax=Molorchus minor TaxID=1323400 RepID=A0ABQ9JSQ3_9CUCU|nr:hypothetical protein NQ317_009402 [Molorchus minor]
MAENAANFTFTYQNRPSIFEIIAQKSLNDTLHPALQKIALFLASNLPEKFSWLNKYYEEAFLMPLFSENFYGLKRVVSNRESLTQHHKELSLIFLVVLPYFKRKLEEKIAVIRIESAEGYLRLEGRLKKFILLSHSTFELAWGLITLNNYLKYMSNKTEFQTLVLKQVDVKLSYAVDQQEASSFWSALFKGNLSLSEMSFGFVKNAVTGFLEVTAFFLQFLQTWNAQRADFIMTELPTVPPPAMDNKAKTYQGKCPICLRPWIIPTVLPVSGYIFCFRCILRCLSENQRCPVTNLPAKPLDVVRLYLN